MVDALRMLGLPNGVCLTSSTSSSTRISLATAGLFVSDESGAEDEKDDDKRLCGLRTGLMQCTSNATKLMQLERYEGIALPLLPQPPATVRDSSGLGPATNISNHKKPGPPGPGWVPDVMVGRQSRSSSAVPNLKCHKMSQIVTIFQICGTKLRLPFVFGSRFGSGSEGSADLLGPRNQDGPIIGLFPPNLQICRSIRCPVSTLGTMHVEINAAAHINDKVTLFDYSTATG